jgi:hypothetical protein
LCKHVRPRKHSLFHCPQRVSRVYMSVGAHFIFKKNCPVFQTFQIQRTYGYLTNFKNCEPWLIYLNMGFFSENRDY